MRSLLSDSELHEQLEAFVSNASLYLNTYNYCVFHTMYVYGFRVSEIFLMPLAVQNPDSSITFKTLKNNNDRVYTSGEITGELMHLYNIRLDLPYFPSRQIYSDYIKRYNEGRRFYVGNKDCSTHIFRHNRIKLLSESGLSLAQIKIFTGIKQDSTVLNYINSEIYQ